MASEKNTHRSLQEKKPGVWHIDHSLYLRVTESTTEDLSREYKPRASDPPGFAPWTAARCRDALAAGLDPIAERDGERVTEHKRRTSSITFDEAAKLCHAARATEFRNVKHSDDWISSLTMHTKGNVTPIKSAAA